jgi:CO/xanthine dehydrogenase Mo-binding subunit
MINPSYSSYSSYSKKSSTSDPLKDAKEKALELFVESIESEVHSLTVELGGVVVPWEGNVAPSIHREKDGMRSSDSIASSRGSGWFGK